MSPRLFFKALVKERLVAAAEEIFQAFESTILKYEEEICSSKQEIERLRGLLVTSAENQKTELLQFSTPNKDNAAVGTDQELMLSDHQRGLELLIKEEQHELWASERNHEENDCGQLRLQSPVCWEKNEEDTKPETHHQKYNWKSKEQTDLQDFRRDEFNVPVASTSQVQDGRERQQTTAKFMDHIQADDNQSSFSTSREAAVVQFCSAASDFHCHLCDKPFSSNQFLINHAFHFHSRNADVLCAVCGKTLESTESLIAHINSHKGPKCCHICGKHCNSTTSLKEHVASHAGVKLHCCPLCGKECGRKGDLKIHMRIHTGEKPFCCSYCCKSFTHSGHLKKHLRSHTGERPHRCNVCGKRFLQSTHLKSHMGTHIQKN